MKDTGHLLEPLDFSHCLRPEFTQNILQAITRDRQSVNLIGEKGTGKTRLLEDIRRCNFSDARIIYVNLKSYVYNYSGLLREIHRQLNSEGDVPDKLDRLFEGLEKKPGYHLAFFDNYDALLDNTRMDAGYNKDFFDDLNFIKNKDNVTLLCTSFVSLNALPIIIEKESYNSWVTLKEISLPDLTRLQITDELDRQSDDANRQWMKGHPYEKDTLVDCIHHHPLPYPRLCFFAERLRDQTYEEHEFEFKRRLKKWLKKFKKLNKKRIDRKLHGVKVTAQSAVTSFGLHKIKIPFKSISDFFKNLGK